MEIVRSLNRSWIYDTYLSLYRAIHPGKKFGGEMSGYHTKHVDRATYTTSAHLIIFYALHVEVGRLIDTDIDIVILEKPKNTDCREIKTDVAIFFRFLPRHSTCIFHNLSDPFIWMLACKSTTIKLINATLGIACKYIEVLSKQIWVVTYLLTQ